MYTYYDKENDYLEFFFESIANFGDADSTNENIVVFKSEKSGEIVGYAMENARREIIKFDKLDTIDKLAILLKISRISRDFSQDEVATRLHISLRHYQRLESGQDTTISLLSDISVLFPETDFSCLFEMKKTG